MVFEWLWIPLGCLRSDGFASALALFYLCFKRESRTPLMNGQQDREAYLVPMLHRISEQNKLLLHIFRHHRKMHVIN